MGLPPLPITFQTLIKTSWFPKSHMLSFHHIITYHFGVSLSTPYFTTFINYLIPHEDDSSMDTYSTSDSDSLEFNFLDPALNLQFWIFHTQVTTMPYFISKSISVPTVYLLLTMFDQLTHSYLVLPASMYQFHWWIDVWRIYHHCWWLHE